VWGPGSGGGSVGKGREQMLRVFPGPRSWGRGQSRRGTDRRPLAGAGSTINLVTGAFSRGGLAA
jgi:hypothetical protein